MRMGAIQTAKFQVKAINGVRPTEFEDFSPGESKARHTGGTVGLKLIRNVHDPDEDFTN